MPRKSSSAKTKTVGCRVTEDEFLQIERKLKLDGYATQTDLVYDLLSRWINGAPRNTLPEQISAIDKKVDALRVDLFEATRFALAAIDEAENRRSDERDEAIEKGLRDALGLGR